MTLIPVTSRPAVRGSNPQIRHDGLFQVDVFVPENQGAGAAEILADAVRAAYTVDDVLTQNSVNVRFEYAERGQGILDTPWFQVPVTIAWYAYAST